MRVHLLLTVFCATPALAQQTVDLNLRTVVAEGAQPSIQIRVFQNLRSLELDARGNHGTPLRRKYGALPAGAVENVVWKQAPGQAEQFRGVLRVRPVAEDGKVEELPVEFEAVVLTPLELQLDKSKVDLENRHLEIVLSREADKCDVVIKGERGETLHEDTIGFSEEAPGHPLPITWPKLAGNLARIELRAYDKWGSYAGIALIPWSLSIPHEEVNFPLDSSDIPTSEKPKLDDSHARIVDALTRYKEIGAIKLFVAGHTDTLASRDYNKKLSNARARAIAVYFKQKGLPMPVFAYGFGEDRPLIVTGDSIAEPRNRRVDYMIAVEPPLGVRWEKL